jgi:hypothetical protein
MPGLHGEERHTPRALEQDVLGIRQGKDEHDVR